MRRRAGRWLSAVIAVALAAAIAWSFAPQPVSVDTARVSRGPLLVTIDEDGKTRVRDRYTISAPVSGYLTRLALRAGDAVVDGRVVATIFPAAPAPIDVRSRRQLQARVDAAIDALRQARVRVDSAEATLAQASRDVVRQEQLERDHVVSPQELDVARTKQQVAQAEVDAARAGVGVASHDVDAARAALVAADADHSSGRVTDVRSPRRGVVLKVFEESARAVQAGAPLLEVGDPAALEVVVDLLSTDAVQVQPGSRVLLERWGGDHALNGIVRRVEPSSFTKVSALGVEEQRVNVIVDFADARDCVPQLGDLFAVDVRVVVWERADALKVPVSALFRRGNGWAVFKVADGRARTQSVRTERQNDLDAAVVDGLADGDIVVVHPSERVLDGTRLVVRRP